MAMQPNTHYYDHQLKTFVLQFMAIFQGLQVQVGSRDDSGPELISVPIMYAAPDRVAAAILNGNTQNKLLRLPIMSAYMRNLSYDSSRATGQGTSRRNSYVPTGGMVPDDIKVVHQRKPLPVIMQFELNLRASNTDQHFQMLEQILPMFEPELMIQTSDSLFDWTRLNAVRLTGINFDGQYPVGTDRRTVQSVLTFEVPGYISTPADVRSDFVNKVFLRVGAVSSSSITNEQMIADLDAGGFEYELIKDGSTLDLGDR